MNKKQRRLEASRKWFANNKEKQREYVRERKKRLYEWYHEYKSQLKCSTCDESHPACLDFHHRDKDEKEIEIPRAINAGWSQERILAEIGKCDVLCANCHRKLHWEEVPAPLV